MSNCFVFFSFSFQKQNAYNIVIIILPDSERFYIKALRKHRILHVFFPTENHCEHVNFYILRSPVACLSELWSSCRGPGQAPPPHHSIHTSSTRNSGTLVTWREQHWAPPSWSGTLMDTGLLNLCYTLWTACQRLCFCHPLLFTGKLLHIYTYSLHSLPQHNRLT